MSPRWFDKRTGDHLALDTGGGPIARFWATALAGIVDIGYIKATGHSVKIYLPKTTSLPEVEFEWKIPKWSNAIERDRARTYFQAYAAAAALHFAEQALAELHAGRTKTWTDFKVPESAIGCGFHEAVRGVLSHHVVIRDHKIANYHPYPPTPWNANPRDIYGTPGPYEDAVQNTPIFEENGPDKFKGIDIMRAVRSFDPCLPCGVHMYLGNGKTIGNAPLADVRAATLRSEERNAVQRWTASLKGRARSIDADHSQPGKAPCPDTSDVQNRIESIESLLGENSKNSGSALSEPVEAAGAIADGFSRLGNREDARDRAPERRRRKHAIDAMGRDDLVRGLLLLYGLHPLDRRHAFQQALEKTRPYLEISQRQRGLVGIDEAGAVTLRLKGIATVVLRRRRR